MWAKSDGCDYRYGREIHDVNSTCICVCKVNLDKITAKGLVCALKSELKNSPVSCPLFS